MVLFGGGLMLNNFGVFLSIMTIISFKAYRISFFRVSQNLQNRRKCVPIFICVSHFLRFKSFFCQTLLDIISAYWICCDLKVIPKKAKIRSPRKIPRYTVFNMYRMYTASININNFKKSTKQCKKFMQLFFLHASANKNY